MVSAKYLGAPISTTTTAFDFLIEAVASRLSGWKGRLLSQAGRAILIKAVLQALPIYYMATTKVPAQVLKKLTSLITRFFWGKMQQDRYLAYISWDRMAVPIGMGGLGFKDLESMNQALLMKSLWRLASQSNSLWAEQIKAKYLPRSELWQSKRIYRCTVFWRALMHLRPTLLPMVSWKVGDGQLCPAFAQPWHPNALLSIPQNQQQRTLRVRDLVHESGNGWDPGQLIQQFGYLNCMQILSSVQPPAADAGEDRLIFMANTNGIYSVRKGYEAIRKSRQVGDPNRKDIWQLVWKKGDVLPRVRLLIWKLLQQAIPLMGILAARMSNLDPICATCGEGNEDVIHFLFQCPFSRGCWFVGPLPVRTDNLPADINDIFRSLYSALTDQQWTDVANVIWSIWRCRNDKIYGAKQPSVESFHKYFSSISIETMVAAAGRTTATPNEHHFTGQQSGFSCYCDGSWQEEWNGGYGVVLNKGEELVAYKAGEVTALCALQTEAFAMKRGMLLVKEMGIQSCDFFTDSANLVDLVNQYQPPVEGDWRAYRQVYECWELLKRNEGFTISHVLRSHNELADMLAKKGRMLKTECIGYTFPMFVQ